MLFECATIGILVTDETGRIELSNPCAEKLFGYSPAELVGKPVEILIPGHLRDKHIHHRENYFAKPKSRPMGLGMELFASKKNGEIFPVEISLGHDELDGEKLAVAFITDVTERLKAKKLVAEREAWFRNMADNSPVMIWVSNTAGDCTYFNNTWLEFTGRTLNQELGNGWAEGVFNEDLDECLAIYKRAFDARTPFVMEYRLKRHDGHYRWLQDVGKPTYSDDIFTGFIGSCSDIHDQRMMKEELELQVRQRTVELHDALSREKEMNELKSRFVSMASHEFRTPLSVIMSSTVLIEKYAGPKEDERIDKHINRVKASLNNLDGILNDFLSLDKLEQGKVDLEYEEFDIAHFMHDIIDGVRSLRKKNQRIMVSQSGEANVILDHKKLRYILVNLVSNSIKYSPEGCIIDLRSETTEDLKITVKDRGIGIPEDEQKHMFNKFFRATNAGSIPGTGLGLTIVKRYVELMNGSISFTSMPGEGTTFYLEFPLS